MRTLVIASLSAYAFLLCYGQFFLGSRSIGSPNLGADQNYREGWSEATRRADAYLENQSISFAVVFSCLLSLVLLSEWQVRRSTRSTAKTASALQEDEKERP